MTKNKVVPIGFKEYRSETDSKNYEAKIEEMRAQSNIAYEKILVTSFKKLHKNQDEITEVSNELWFNINEMIFFLSGERKKDLWFLELPEGVWKWFIQIEKIEIQLNRINRMKGLHIESGYAILMIQKFLHWKIFNSVLVELKKTKKIKNGKYPYNLFHVEIFSYFLKKGRQQEKGEVFSKNFQELFSHHQFVQAQIALKMTDQQFKKWLSNATQGKTEKYFLANLFDSVFVVEGFSIDEDQIYLALSDLLILVIKDKKILTKDQFLEGSEYRKMTYDAYKIQTLKRIVGRGK